MTETLSNQVTRVVSENQRLRIKSHNDDKTIHLLKDQYDALAGSLNTLRDRYEREAHAARTERDQAIRRFKEMETLLLQSADLVMQALGARRGDGIDQSEAAPVQQDPPAPKPPVDDRQQSLPFRPIGSAREQTGPAPLIADFTRQAPRDGGRTAERLPPPQLNG